MDPREALRELATYSSTCPRVALVGHEPDFSHFAEYVLGVEEGSIHVKKASIILLTVHPPHSGGILHFNLWPTMLAD